MFSVGGFGYRLASALPLDFDAVEGPVDLTIAPGTISPPRSQSLLKVHLWNPSGGGTYELHAIDEGFRLSVEPVGVFSIQDRRVLYARSPGADDAAVTWHLLGNAIGLWLELRGRTVLHGAALVKDGFASAFLGPSGTGKTALSLSLLKSEFRLLGDDHVVIRSPELTVAPAVPWVKVAPDLARYLGIPHADLPALHPRVLKRRYLVPEAMRCATEAPLRRLYQLERGGASTPVLTRLSPSDSVAALVRHSFAPRTVAAAGLAPRRLARLAQIAGVAEVWRVQYPSGLDSLARVVDALERHHK